MLRVICAGLAFLFVAATGAQAQAPDLGRFVDPPAVWSGRLSPSGRQIAFVRKVDDTIGLFVLNTESGQSRLVQHMPEVSGSIDWVSWKGEDRLIFGVSAIFHGTGALVEEEPDPDARRYVVGRVFSVSAAGGDLTQMFEGQMRRFAWGPRSMFLVDTLPGEPDHVLLFAWDDTGAGLWRANVLDGRVERVANGTWDTFRYATDGVGYPVIRLDVTWTGYRVMRRASGAEDWSFMFDVRRTATMTNSPDFQVVRAGPGPNQVYVIARPEGQDLSALYLFDTAAGALGEPLQMGAEADLAVPWLHPQTRELIAACEVGPLLRCQARERGVQRHLDAVNAYFENKAVVSLIDMSSDTMVWLLAVEAPNLQGAYYYYDRRNASLTPVLDVSGAIPVSDLSPTEIVSYTSRDETPLWAYVTARPGSGPRPMVVLPHGGPEARDYYGYDSFTQFLASRGYVVVQPNFRGSGGFGRSFADAGRGQWGKLMQDDVTDAVRHMIDAGVADPERICIVGISYGGYAALAGATFTPDIYQCAVSIAGVSDLLESLREERRDSRFSSSYHYWRRSIGDPGRDREALIATSPARQAARIQIPVLLLHGEDDGIVPARQSELMEEALREAGKEVRYQHYEEEGHPFGDWEREHEIAVYREVERFLAQHLGE